MGGSVSAGRDNDELTDNLVHSDCIFTKMVEKVFRTVDRGSYYTPKDSKSAYEDSAWRDNHLHLSAPSIYAKVMEALKLRRNLSFLNMGSGTGYLSTMVGLIIGSGPNSCNHGVEYYEDTVQYAYMKLEQFIQTSNSFDEYEFCAPQFFTGNCLRIFTDTRYDRIYCGAMCEENDLMFIKDLLKIGGIAVVPVGHQLLEISRKSEEEFEQESIAAVTFAELIPATQNEEVRIPDIEVQSLKALCRGVVRGCIRTNMQRRLGDLNVRRIPRHDGDNLTRFLHSRRVNSFVARYGNMAAAVANAHEADSDTTDNNDDTIDFSDEEEVMEERAEAPQEEGEVGPEAMDRELQDIAGQPNSTEEMDSSDKPVSKSSNPASPAADSMVMEESLPGSSSTVVGSADSGFSSELAHTEPDTSSQNDLSPSSRESNTSPADADTEPAASDSGAYAAYPEPPAAEVNEEDDTSSGESHESDEELDVRRQRRRRRLARLICDQPPEPQALPQVNDDDNERALNREKAHHYHLAFAQTMYSSVISLPLPTTLKDYVLYYRNTREQLPV